MLNELDKELFRRGHKFVRYADDCLILCRSKRAVARVRESIFTYIESRQDRGGLCRKVKYLGYSFYKSTYEWLRHRIRSYVWKSWKKRQIASELRNRRMPDGDVRGRKMKVGRKLLRFPPTRLYTNFYECGN